MAQAPLTQFQQAIEWIGFTDQAHRDAMEQELGDLATVKELSSKDIRDLRDGYAKRTAAEGRIHFGVSRTKRLQALIYWLRDLERIDEEPDIDDLDQESFLQAIQTASDRGIATMQASVSSTLDGGSECRSTWEA